MQEPLRQWGTLANEVDKLFKRFEHIGVMVKDLDRSVAFYRDVLGLPLRERVRVREGMEIAFLPCGESEVELICTQGDFPRDGITNHLAFATADIAGDLARLAAAGVELLDREPRYIPPLRAYVAFCRGPDGEKLELFQRD